MFNSSIKLLPTKRINENNTKINTKLINLITISIKDKRKSIREEDMAYLGEQEKGMKRGVVSVVVEVQDS